MRRYLITTHYHGKSQWISLIVKPSGLINYKPTKSGLGEIPRLQANKRHPRLKKNQVCGKSINAMDGRVKTNFMLALILIATCLASHVAGNHHNPMMKDGRTTIVHLFEWKWDDIAEECEVFLGPYGYGGVQVSPPNENGILWEPDWNRNVRRPWFERYQPVSYKLVTRSGTEEQFISMVRRCNNAGVRIYVDAVINHMTGSIGRGTGTGGSSFDSGVPRYDGVPYGPEHFTPRSKCNSNNGGIQDYNDANQVRNCELSGLHDLDQSQEYVRNKIVEYLNRLIDIGVAGFRIDAAKHMWPQDLQVIFSRLHDLNTDYFPSNSKPFIFMEVIDLGNEAVKSEQYVHLGRVTEFRYGKELGDVIRKNDNQRLAYLKNFGHAWAMVHDNNALAFVDNHDNQRGHGAGGFGTILTHFESRMYKMATAFMLAWPYGVTRVMSSYNWPRYIQDGKDVNDWIGPPHDGNYNIKSVIRNDDMTCGNGWVCEHRWRQIYNMVRFRNVVLGQSTPVTNWWDNGYHQIAFSRGNKGFIAINNEHYPMEIRLQTGLPGGRYCDIISGNKSGNTCTGQQIFVDNEGFAQLYISNTQEDPMIAIHIESKVA